MERTREVDSFSPRQQQSSNWLSGKRQIETREVNISVTSFSFGWKLPATY